MIKRSFVYFLLWLLLSSAWLRPVFAQEHKSDFAELEKVILEELKATNTPGAAIAIVSGDKVIFVKGFGTSNIETGAPVTPDMLFRIGSTTKMYTTYALVALAEEGKIKLDSQIGNYVNGLSPKLSQVTAHQLMSHSAGVKDDAPAFGPHDESTMATTVRSWKDDYLFTEPGRIMSYSNPGLTLAGFVLQEVGGKSYADQISERLFKPLGMASTTFRPTEAMTRPLSQGHNAFGKARPVVVRPFADNAAYWPAGFMFSNVLDLSRFAVAFMNGGMIDGKQVLSPSVITKLSTGYVDAPSLSEGAKYGYGLMVRDHRGVRVVEHGGAIDGFGCLFQMVPEQRFAVIILANKSGQSLGKAADKAMELMLPLKAKDDAAKKEIPMSEAEMKEYIGVYAQNTLKLEMFVKDGKLFAKLQGMEAAVTKTGNNRLSMALPISPEPLAIVVVRGADGKIEYIHGGLRALRKEQASK